MDKKRTAFANRICNEKSYLQMELLSDLHIYSLSSEIGRQ